MIAYLDTSALVKKYLQEPGSQRVVELWRESEEIAVSAVGFAEAMAAFHRKKREGSISPENLDATIDTFRGDWASLNRIEVSGDLNELIEHLVESYPLRGLDAIHLASAIWIMRALPDSLVFVSGDAKLLAAAEKESLDFEAV